jgi:GNAT superfamily N-acetyltransferase
MADVFAAVAEERDGIATEPPVDVEARAASWTLDGTFVALVGTELLGSVHVEVSEHGFGEIGMAVSREWRGRGVGSALMVAAIEWAREQGLHKLSLSVWPRTPRRSRSTVSTASSRRGAAASRSDARAASSGTSSTWACCSDLVRAASRGRASSPQSSLDRARAMGSPVFAMAPRSRRENHRIIQSGRLPKGLGYAESAQNSPRLGD